MAKREFNLPGIQDLSKEQEDARKLPKQGQHLIIGGPGTGKSVLALLRARLHQQDKDDYVFLVYNKLLLQSSQQLFGKDQNHLEQWQSWFFRVFKNATGKAVPRLPPENGWQEIDWIATLEIIKALPPPEGKKYPFIIIDEGQDMPPEFYQALGNIWFENFYVLADQNQRIDPKLNSNIKELRQELGKNHKDVIELKNNYRNTLPIARLAREFYTGDPATPPPELPNRPSIIRPLLFEYKEDQFKSIIERILINADVAPNKLIGLIAPNNNVRERYFNALKRANIKLDNGKPRIETYASGQDSKLNFNEGGIMVINAFSCKGLEFDTVFLVDINHHQCEDPEQTKRLFYVMVARAKEKVIMLKEAGKHCPIDAILPQDIDILERK